MNRFSRRPEGYGRENPVNEAAAHEGWFGAVPGDGPRGPMTRVTINALISGEMWPSDAGPEMAERLRRVCAASGNRLHSLDVEVVQMPLTCPGCGRRALYRSQRKGFLQARLFPLFGLYPWNCTCCRRPRLLRLRRPPLPPPVSQWAPAAEHRRAA